MMIFDNIEILLRVISKDQTAVIQSCGNNLVKNASWCCWIQWNRIPINIVSKCIQKKIFPKLKYKTSDKTWGNWFLCRETIPRFFFPKNLRPRPWQIQKMYHQHFHLARCGLPRLHQDATISAYEKHGFWMKLTENTLEFQQLKLILKLDLSFLCIYSLNRDLRV